MQLGLSVMDVAHLDFKAMCARGIRIQNNTGHDLTARLESVPRIANVDVGIIPLKDGTTVALRLDGSMATLTVSGVGFDIVKTVLVKRGRKYTFLESSYACAKRMCF
jgi:hypothetical protein